MAPKLPQGFAPMTGRPEPRLIVNATGRRGAGKSHLIMTMVGLAVPKPRPLAVMDIDLGIQRAKPKKAPKDAFHKRYELDINPEALNVQGIPGGVKQEMQAKAGTLWNQLVSDAKLLTAEGFNIGVDGAPEAWEILRYSEFGTQSNVKHLFTRVNMIYRKWLRIFENGPGNVVFTSRKKEMWEDYIDKDNKVQQRPSGRWERAGFADMEYVVDCEIDLEQNEQGEMIGTLVKMGWQHELVGMVLESDKINMEHLIGLAFD